MPPAADPKEKAKIARELGIDRPIAEQYVSWISGLSRGDLGFAYVSERPAIEEIAPRIPISAKLAGMAVLISVLLGVPFGVISAVRQNSGLDYFLQSHKSKRAIVTKLLARAPGADGVRPLVRHDSDLR